MKILFIGDICGRPGREVIKRIVPEVKAHNNVDLVIANCENAAGGRGITRQVLDELSSSGIDYFTSGEHVWSLGSFLTDLQDKSLPLVRPFNYDKEEQLPGKGYDILEIKGERIFISVLLGQIFMRDSARNPFWAIEDLLEKMENDGFEKERDTFIVDFHAEATSEKLTFGYNLKNIATAVLGTHTHVPTADERLIDNTAYVTDVGMVGPLDASLWVQFSDTLHNFKYPFKKKFTMEEEGRRVFNSVLIETEKGKAKNIKRIDKII